MTSIQSENQGSGNGVSATKADHAAEAVTNNIYEKILKSFEAKNLLILYENLTNGFPINYKDATHTNRPLLYYAAHYDFVEGVDVLLQRGADAMSADNAMVTPLHMAASSGSFGSLIKLISAGVDPNAEDIYGKSPLHYATLLLSDKGSIKSVKIVESLLDAGANVCSRDKDGRTPLHSAAIMGNIEVLPLLVSGTGAGLLFSKDKDGRVPLHHAVIGARSIAAVEFLLHAHSPIDAADKDGKTALHYVAARPINYVDDSFDGTCLELLLSHGMSVDAKDDSGYNALSLALQKTMWWRRQSPRDIILHSVQTLIEKGSPILDTFDMWRIVETFPSLAMMALNQSIRASTTAKDSPHMRIKFDFRPLIRNSRLLKLTENQKLVQKQRSNREDNRKKLQDSRNNNRKSKPSQEQKKFPSATPTEELPIPYPLLRQSEITILYYIHWAGHRQILSHPLCSTFLHLKWLKARKFLIANLCFYLLYVFLFTGIIINCEWDHKGSECLFPNLKHSLFTPLIICSCIAVFRELIQVIHSPQFYLQNYENYVDITFIVCNFVIAFENNPLQTITSKNIAAVGAIAGWGRLMLILGQFPNCGVYIVLFSTVCKTVLRFLSLYIPLLIGFALGFYIVLGKISPFTNFPISLVTALVMMTGELDYVDKMEQLPSNAFSYLLLVVFILLILIILSNLLVALAVNDLTGIQQRSELLRLTRQVEMLLTVETFVRSPLLMKPLRNYLTNCISVFQSHSKDTVITIYPNKKLSFSENLFVTLTNIVGHHIFVAKLFEYHVPNFIPPAVDPQLPSQLVKEAIQLSLIELEIKKRDKLMLAKSQQLSTSKHILITKRKPQNQGIVFEDTESDVIQGAPFTNRPSIRASLLRASINLEACKHFRQGSAVKSNPEQNQMEELKNKVQHLQETVEVLISKLSYPLTDAIPIRKNKN